MAQAKSAAEKAGDSRLVKVLVRPGDGHRGYPVGIHAASKSMVVVAATEKVESGFVCGRLYLVQETDPGQHPWVVREVSCVPHEEGWQLLESMVDDAAGHVDTF